MHPNEIPLTGIENIRANRATRTEAIKLGAAHCEAFNEQLVRQTLGASAGPQANNEVTFSDSQAMSTDFAYCPECNANLSFAAEHRPWCSKPDGSGLEM